MSNNIIQIMPLNNISRCDIVLNFLRAVERFRYYALRNRTPGDNTTNESFARAAFGESMYWFYTVDDQMRRAKQNEFTNVGLCNAFHQVRNLAQHLGWYPIATKISITAGKQTNVWVWGDASDKRRRGSADYKKHLLSRDVLATLDELALQMWEIRKWQITLEDMKQPGFKTNSSIQFDVRR